jgi:hypothetical protein
MITTVNLDSLNCDQCATLLCITKRQLQNLVKAGLPSNGLGRQRRFVWEDVRPWYLRRKILEGMSLDQSTKAAITRLMEEPL